MRILVRKVGANLFEEFVSFPILYRFLAVQMHDIMEGVILPLGDVALHGEDLVGVSLVIDGHVAFDEYNVDREIFGEPVVGVPNHLSSRG